MTRRLKPALLAFTLLLAAATVLALNPRALRRAWVGPLLFAAGADSLMTGDYLTTRGRLPDDDRQMLADLGLELVQEAVGPAGGPAGTTT